MIVGLAVGAGLTYLFIQKQLNDLKDAQKSRVRQVREDMERDFELRIQTAVQAVQAERDRTVKQLRDDYEQRITLLQSQQSPTGSASAPSASVAAPAPLADPWDNRRAAAPEPALEPAPAAPEPKPTPEPVAESVVEEPIVEEPIAEEETPATEPSIEPSIEASEKVVEAAGIGVSVAKPAIAQLKQNCYSSDPEVRSQVAVELADHLMGAETEQSLALLEKLAGDRQAVVRIAAMETLADAQIPDTIPVLSQALRDANPAVVRIASKGLDGMKGEKLTVDDAFDFDDLLDSLPSNGVTKGSI